MGRATEHERKRLATVPIMVHIESGTVLKWRHKNEAKKGRKPCKKTNGYIQITTHVRIAAAEK